MTMGQADAVRAILDTHQRLLDGVAGKVDELHAAVARQEPFERQKAELVAFMVEAVLPHAAAEEHTVFRTAATRSVMAPSVDEMAAEHRRLTALTQALAGASTLSKVLRAADELCSLLASHLSTENEELVLRLRDEGRADLVEMLVDVRYAVNRVKSSKVPRRVGPPPPGG
jgi:hypothetical protein